MSNQQPDRAPAQRALRVSSLVVLLLAGCATLSPPAVEMSEQDRARVKDAFAGIDARRLSRNQNDGWLRDAYQEIHLRNLREIPQQDLAGYRRYVADGSIFIIVHPGYFPFFDTWDIARPTFDYATGMPRENLVDRTTADLPASDTVYRTAREQERIVRDLVAYLAAERRLVVLILPRDYRDHVTYGAAPGYDEYARYLNEISGEAENVVFLESAAYDQGTLRPGDLDVLIRFFKASGVRSVNLGGGFIGKCLDGFYKTLREIMLPGYLFYVPEVTQFSPKDLKRDGTSLLTDDGRISRKKLYRYFSSFAYDPSTEEWLPWIPLPFYDVEQYR